MGTSQGPASAVTSTRRTDPWARANTSAACGKVTERSNGLTKNRSETWTFEI